MYKICSCTHTISIETNNIHVRVCARVCVCVRACVFPLLSFGSACVHQRRLCSPAAVLPYHVTSHLLRVRSQIARLHCPTHISLLPSFSTDVIPPPPGYAERQCAVCQLLHGGQQGVVWGPPALSSASRLHRGTQTLM